MISSDGNNNLRLTFLCYKRRRPSPNYLAKGPYQRPVTKISVVLIFTQRDAKVKQGSFNRSHNSQLTI